MEIVSKTEATIRVRRKIFQYEYKEYSVQLPFYYKIKYKKDHYRESEYGCIEEDKSTVIIADSSLGYSFHIETENHLDEVSFENPNHKCSKEEFEEFKKKAVKWVNENIS